jgi:hypothetical protein
LPVAYRQRTFAKSAVVSMLGMKSVKTCGLHFLQPESPTAEDPRYGSSTQAAAGALPGSGIARAAVGANSSP